MDELTRLIHDEIMQQYGTLQAFINQTGIKYSTMTSAFIRGIGGSSYVFVTRVCRILGLKRLFDEEIPEMSREQFRLAKEMEGLDAAGMEAIRSKIQEEKERCKAEKEAKQQAKAMKSLKKAEKASMVVRSLDGDGIVSENERIKQLIREVLAEQNEGK